MKVICREKEDGRMIQVDLSDLDVAIIKELRNSDRIPTDGTIGLYVGQVIREQGGEEGFRQEMEKWGEHLYLEGWDAGL